MSEEQQLVGIKFYYKIDNTYDIYIFVDEEKLRKFSKEYLDAFDTWVDIDCCNLSVAKRKAKKIFGPIFKKYLNYYELIEKVKPEEIDWNKYI